MEEGVTGRLRRDDPPKAPLSYVTETINNKLIFNYSFYKIEN